MLASMWPEWNAVVVLPELVAGDTVKMKDGFS
jgi:hypothetical protein